MEMAIGRCPHVKQIQLEGFEIPRELLCHDSCTVNGIVDDSRLTDSLDASHEIGYRAIKPYIPMLKELLLEAALPSRLAQCRLQRYLPEYVDPGLLIPPGKKESPGLSTFHCFMRLPSELRRRIWLLAADQARRVMLWQALDRTRLTDQESWDFDPYAVNAPKNIPRMAQTCRDAWEALTQTGCYIPSRGEMRDPTPYWCAFDDIIYFKIRDDSLGPADTLCLQNHRNVAIALRDLGSALTSDWSWLHDLRSLSTVYIILAENGVTMGPELYRRYSDRGVYDLRGRTNDTLLHTMVCLDDDSEKLRGLDRHWAMHSGWLASWATFLIERTGDGSRYGPGSSIASGEVTGVRCLRCHLDIWNTVLLDRIKTAWLEYGPQGSRNISPESREQAARRMPRFRPAILFEIYGE